MRSRKWVYPLIVLLIASVIIGYRYIYPDHRDISSEKAVFSLNAASFKQAFQDNEQDATATYQDQTIEVSGVLTSVNGTTLVIDNSVFFALSENETPPEKSWLNTQITVKGRCTGYDSLLEEVNLDQASIIK